MRQVLLIAFLLQCTYSFAQPRVSVYAGYQIDSRYRGDGGPATTSVQTTSALLHSATNIALDSANNMYLSETGIDIIRKIDFKTKINY